MPRESLSAFPSSTRVEAKVEVGWGNTLYIRGEGDGLSWDKGTPLACRDAASWQWSTPQAKGKIVFKLLLNDQVWASGADFVVEAGGQLVVTPVFSPAAN